MAVIGGVQMLWSISKHEMEQRHSLFQIDDRLTYVGKMLAMAPTTVGASAS
jgi:hypothetical protein